MRWTQTAAAWAVQRRMQQPWAVAWTCRSQRELRQPAPLMPLVLLRRLLLQRPSWRHLWATCNWTTSTQSPAMPWLQVRGFCETWYLPLQPFGAGRVQQGPCCVAVQPTSRHVGACRLHRCRCTRPLPLHLVAGAGPLSLEAALAEGPSTVEPTPPPIVPAPTDVAAAEADPLAALEEAVGADKPK